jgi:hypothetical protein
MRLHKPRASVELAYTCSLVRAIGSQPENCTLLGYYAEIRGNSLPNFRDKLIGLSSAQLKIHVFWDATLCLWVGGSRIFEVSCSLYIHNTASHTKICNPLNAELNSICHLLALLGAHPILHVSRIRVNLQRYAREHLTPHITNMV